MEACPKCGEAAVEFDVVAGVAACESCGAVLSEEQLVHSAHFDDAAATTYVGGGDTGENAAVQAAAGGGTAAIQRSRQSTGESRLKGRAREFCSLLRLQPAVTQQALHLLGQAIPHLMGSWRRDQLAAAATYAACRLNRLPLTLADLSGATQLDVYVLGVRYVALCRVLGLQPPLLLAADLLPRAADKVLAELVASGQLGGPAAAALRRDAAALLDWMQRQLVRMPYPMMAVGAALVLAAEMNAVSLGLRHVSASLALNRGTLERKLTLVRQRLVQLAPLLPYATAINTRNVGSHARTIMQLSALVGGGALAGGALTAGGGGAQGIERGQAPLALTAGPAAEQQQRQAGQQPAGHQQAGQQQQQAGQQPAGHQQAGQQQQQQQPEQKQADAPGDAAAERRAKRRRRDGATAAAPQQQAQQQRQLEPGGAHAEQRAAEASEPG